MNLTGLYVYKRIIIYWHIFHSSGFHHICNIKCRLVCRYSPQNIFNAKNFNPHKKPISLLNLPICTQGMQRTWWPEAGTIIVTGPYWSLKFLSSAVKSPKVWIFKMLLEWVSIMYKYSVTSREISWINSCQTRVVVTRSVTFRTFHLQAVLENIGYSLYFPEAQRGVSLVRFILLAPGIDR